MKKIVALVLFFIILTSFYSHVSANDTQIKNDEFKRTYSEPYSQTLNGVAYGNNLYIAVGKDGTILSSINARSWTFVHINAMGTLNSVTFADGKFISVGNSGLIISSNDGLKWSIVPSGTINNLTHITFINRCFYAVGEKGTILKSVDGTTWEIIKSATNTDFNGIGYGNSTYVLIGNTGFVFVSPDGVYWTKVHVGNFSGLYSIAWTGKEFIAVGDSGIKVMSEDGKSWTSIQTSALGRSSSILYHEGIYITTGDAGMEVSRDGLKWDLQNSYFLTDSRDVTMGRNEFVAVGNYGEILLSNDGSNWEEANQGDCATLWDVAYGGGRFVTTGVDKCFLTSVDGRSWAFIYYELDEAFNDIEWIKDRFYAIGDAGSIIYSFDGVQWMQIAGNRNKFGYCSKIIYAKGVYVIAGKYIITSNDGVKWAVNDFRAPNNSCFISLTYGNGKFIAVCSDGSFVSSLDGKRWSVVRYSNPSIKNVTWGNGKFVGVGSGIYSSLDGMSWTQVKNGLFGDIEKVTWTGNKFIAFKSDGSLFTSSDAKKWILYKINSTNALSGWATNGSGVNVFTGDAQTILTNIENDNTFAKKNTMVFQISTSCFQINGVNLEYAVAGYDCPYRNKAVMVPLIPIIKWFGGTVAFNNSQNKYEIQFNKMKIDLCIGNKSIKIDGKPYIMDAEPMRKANEVMVPVSFLSKLDFKVEMNSVFDQIILSR